MRITRQEDPQSLVGGTPIVEERANSEPPQRATKTAMAFEKEKKALHNKYKEFVEKAEVAMRKARDLNAKWMEEENSRAWGEETPDQASGKEERELRRAQANREAQEARKAEEEARLRYNQFQEADSESQGSGKSGESQGAEEEQSEAMEGWGQPWGEAKEAEERPQKEAAGRLQAQEGCQGPRQAPAARPPSGFE